MILTMVRDPRGFSHRSIFGGSREVDSVNHKKFLRTKLYG